MEKLKALIFDVQRFSVHDGDGIRTTVFFKGCSLRCWWCHNPEGIAFQQHLIFSKNKCIACRLCEKVSNGAIHFNRENIPSIDYSKDFDLSKVSSICPTGAFELDSKLWTVDTLVDEVIKDLPFYKYGGGVTASGGECLLQADFLHDFFSKLKTLKIHTAIETALNVPLEDIKKVLPVTDQIFFDLKTLDEDTQEKYIGGNLKRIVENATWILESEYAPKVIVRTPLIPGITDTNENIKAISTFITDIYPEVAYELLNYNNFAGSKYEKLGQDYLLSELRPLTTERVDELLTIAQEGGVKKVINR